MVVGCGSVTAGVTPGKTGLCPAATCQLVCGRSLLSLPGRPDTAVPPVERDIPRRPIVGRRFPDLPEPVSLAFPGDALHIDCRRCSKPVTWRFVGPVVRPVVRPVGLEPTTRGSVDAIYPIAA
jgi:hypothetical protein